MIVLSDTDVVHKLACCELLIDFLQYLKCPPNEVWVLRALPYMLNRKLAGAPLAIQNLAAFMKRVRFIPAAKVQTLERFESLDPGERQLLALVCDDMRITQVVTGDKRALVQIASLASSDQQLDSRLKDTSIHCFESVVLGLLKTRGFSIIKARVEKWGMIKGQTVDGAIKLAFPKEGDAEHAENTLSNYVEKLKENVPFVYLPTRLNSLNLLSPIITLLPVPESRPAPESSRSP